MSSAGQIPRVWLGHGFGLSTGGQDIALSPDALVASMVVLGIGVEIGPVIAQVTVFGALAGLRHLRRDQAVAVKANAARFAVGLVLFGMQAAA